MVMTLAEQYATLGALPAIFDMQQFMTLEVMACSERSITHVARKGRLADTLVRRKICLTCEMLFTNVADKGAFFFMLPFVFHKLRYIGEVLIALLTLIPTCWYKYMF